MKRSTVQPFAFSRWKGKRHCEDCQTELPRSYHLRICKGCRKRRLQRFRQETLTPLQTQQAEEW